MQRKKRRTLGKAAVRSIGNATLEVIQKRRTEKPEVRQASRDAALREIKERAKKAKADKAKSVGSDSLRVGSHAGHRVMRWPLLPPHHAQVPSKAQPQQQKAAAVGRGKR